MLLNRRNVVAGLVAVTSTSVGALARVGAAEASTTTAGSTSVYNVVSYGATGNGSTDDSAAVQAAINAAQSAGGGVIYFPKGNYRCTSTVRYTLNSRGEFGGVLSFQGDGRNISTLRMYGANLTDNSSGWSKVWNNGYTILNVDDMTLQFSGNSSSAVQGGWVAPCTLPQMTHVMLIVDGVFPNNSTVLLGSASGPEGQTCNWRDVQLWLQASGGTSVNFLRTHFDTMIWDGGTIYTNFSGSVSDPHVLYLDAVFSYSLRNLSVYRSDSVSAVWASVSNSDDGVITFEGCEIPGRCSTHFKNAGNSTAPIVIVRSCSRFQGSTLPFLRAGSPLPTIIYEGMRDYLTPVIMR